MSGSNLKGATLLALSLLMIASTAGASGFKLNTLIPVDTDPNNVALGDFNRDGKLDLAVASGDSIQTVSVFLGNGDGSFQPQVRYAVGSFPYGLAVADVNLDGILDLIVANHNDGTVSVLLGNGDGTFQPRVEYTTAIGAFGVAAGDLDGDGKLDLVTANFVTDGITGLSVLTGNGDGTFQPVVDYRSGSDSISVTIGDLNGDGAPDLSVVNYEGFSVSVFLNTVTKGIR